MRSYGVTTILWYLEMADRSPATQPRCSRSCSAAPRGRRPSAAPMSARGMTPAEQLRRALDGWHPPRTSTASEQLSWALARPPGAHARQCGASSAHGAARSAAPAAASGSTSSAAGCSSACSSHRRRQRGPRPGAAGRPLAAGAILGDADLHLGERWARGFRFFAPKVRFMCMNK